MDIYVAAIVWLGVLMKCHAEVDSIPGLIQEYCKLDTFHPVCDHNHVIVMKQAQFGRMRMSRCVSTNHGHVGCSADVMHILDEECSGKRECEVSVTDIRLVKMQPCPADFYEYLEAKYDCVPVLAHGKEDCTQNHVIELLDSYGTISSYLAPTMCPFKITAEQGRTTSINITDFSVPLNNTSVHYDYEATVCVPLLYIEEVGLQRPVAVCGSTQRNKLIYTSQTNDVQIMFKQTHIPFLLHYEVVGCANFQIPDGAYATYHDVTMTIRCNYTDQMYILTCKHGVWVGPIDSCSRKDVFYTNKQSNNDDGMPSLGVSFLIVFGVAAVIVIYVAAMIVCVTYLKRHRREKERATHHNYNRKDRAASDLLRYEQIDRSSPRHEQVPMLHGSKQSTVCVHTPPLTEYADKTCRVHGPIAINECPYAAFPPACVQCEPNMTQSERYNSEKRRNKEQTDEILDIYGMRSSPERLKFATINSRTHIPKAQIGLNIEQIEHATEQNVPDILPPTQNEHNENREQLISSFKSL